MAAFQITCPKCKLTLRTASDPASGATIRCPGCKSTFKLPTSRTSPSSREDIQPVRSLAPTKRSQPRDEDEEETKPRRKSTAKREGGSGKGLLIGGIIGGLAVIGLGVFAFIALNSDRQPDPIVRNDPPQDKKNDGGPVVDPGRGKDREPVKDADKEPMKDAGKVPPPSNQQGLSREVLDRVKKATVYIRVTDNFGRQASGTGFFAMSDDIVLTNAHVVGMLEEDSKPPRTVQVVLNSGLADEKSTSAAVVTVDRTSDLAVLRVAPIVGTSWPAQLPIGSARELQETQKVYVIGYPFGERLGKNVTVSESSVSSLRTNQFGHLVQVQVNGGMHPGNSGGPVIDDRGNVIGVAVAGIRATQINFAIPGDFVQTLKRGRISTITIENPHLKDGQLLANMTIELIDPLKSVSGVGVDWWIGDPGHSRPPAEMQPALLPTDGPRTTTKCTYNAATGVAETALPLGVIPERPKVLYYQPFMVDAEGKQHWVGAMSKAQIKPTDSEPALLSRQIAPGRSPLEFRTTGEFTLKGNGEKQVVKKNIVGRFWEDVRQMNPDATVVTYLSVADRFEVEHTINSKPPPASPRAKQILQDADKLGLIVVTNRGDAALQKFVDNERVPASSRAALNSLVDQLYELFDLCNPPLPGGQVQPGRTWQSVKTVPIDLMDEEPIRGRLIMGYGYRGVRNTETGKVAVISMAGKLQGLSGRNSTANGEASGEALFDLATRRLVDVNVRMEVALQMRIGEETVQVNGMLEFLLIRGKAQPLPEGLPSIEMVKTPTTVKPPDPMPVKASIKEVRQFVGHTSRAPTIAFSQDNRLFTSCSREMICIWEVATGKLVTKIQDPQGFSVQAFSFSKDGSLLLAGGIGGAGTVAKVYRTADGSVVSTFNDHYMTIRAGWLSADGATAITEGNDEVVRVWDARTGKSIRVLKPEIGLLGVLAVTSDGKFAVIGGRAMTVIDVETGAKLRVLEPPASVVVMMPDDRHILTNSLDGSIRMFDITTGKQVKSMPGHRQLIDHLSISVDGKRAVTTAQDGTRVWDLTLGKPIAAPEMPGGFGATRISADGKYMVNFHEKAEHSLFELP
jgi:S1-C subfamily serine protease/WD40 repeat protein